MSDEGFHVEDDHPPQEPRTIDAIKFTEDAQAKAFVDSWVGDMKYVAENDQWYFFNGVFWEQVNKLKVIESARQLNRSTAHLMNNKEQKKKQQLSSRRFSQQVEAYARGDKRCLLALEELDKDPMLLGTPDGIIDLCTGQYITMGLKPYVTMTTAVPPAVAANEQSCPLFLQFMDEFTCGDPALKRFLLQYAGYCLTGDMREQCLIFLYGDGDNGKSVFISLLRWLLKDYAMNAAVDLFVTTSVGKHATGFADLHRRRCVIANETQEGQTLRMDKIKQITGQDAMRANYMRRDNFEFLPVCKLVMFGNHKPNLPDVGKAVRKRIRMVPCNLRLAEGQMDRDLFAKLQKEGAGILRALIVGCRDWQANGLVVPHCVDEQTDRYFYNQDHFGQWFEESCEEDRKFKVTSAAVWQSWVDWTDQKKSKTGTEAELTDRLEARGFERLDHVPLPDGRRPRGWKGFRLRVGQTEMRGLGPEPPPHTEYPK
jgi:putative DNA primase/helicase